MPVRGVARIVVGNAGRACQLWCRHMECTTMPSATPVAAVTPALPAQRGRLRVAVRLEPDSGRRRVGVLRGAATRRFGKARQVRVAWQA